MTPLEIIGAVAGLANRIEELERENTELRSALEPLKKGVRVQSNRPVQRPKPQPVFEQDPTEPDDIPTQEAIQEGLQNLNKFRVGRAD